MAVDDVQPEAFSLLAEQSPLPVIEQYHGRESRDVMEVLLSAHATHFLDGPKAGIGIMVEGPSSSKKTTLLRSLYGLEEQINRSDKLTPASFVSHDASRTEDELEEIDLLPRLRDKTLICPDMATWFDGPEEQIRERWSVFARVLDGDGYTRDSGSHGRRGYDDDIRFNFLGATTPIPPRGHRVMGHVGNRFLFAGITGNEQTDREIAKDVLRGDEYGKIVDACNKATRFFLGNLWDIYGGPRTVDWSSDPSDDVIDGIAYLAKLVRYARAPLRGDEPEREGPARLQSMLYDLARGHALLEGRELVVMDDLAVSTRAALDTMPSKRRGVVRALVSPDTDSEIDTNTVLAWTDLSRPTARSRMDLMDKLGLAWVYEPDSTESKSMTMKSEFEWPDGLPWPD